MMYGWRRGSSEHTDALFVIWEFVLQLLNDEKAGLFVLDIIMFHL
jgi:hypothetical protein